MDRTPSDEQVVRHLRRTNDVARRAIELGRHPFGAILVGPDHERVLMEQCNISTVEHAEAFLARAASTSYTAGYLWTCTLYTNCEPCAMCAGTIYWANIGRVVFGITEERLLSLTGDHAENPTLQVSCRYIFDHGQKPIETLGPIAGVEAETVALHATFWKER